MTRVVLVMAAFACVLCSTARAGAQGPPSAAGEFKRWDVDGGVAFRASDRHDAAINRDNLIPADDRTDTLAVGIGVGRYWTPHLKLDVGVLHHETISTSFYDRFTAPNGAAGTTYTDASTALTELLLAVSRQFGENWFTHPYVSAGLRTGFARTRERGSSIAGANFTPPLYVAPVDRRYSQRILRPYIAGGAKFYFNERTFTRLDLAVGLKGSGVSQWALRVGFGKDL